MLIIGFKTRIRHFKDMLNCVKKTQRKCKEHKKKEENYG